MGLEDDNYTMVLLELTGVLSEPAEKQLAIVCIPNRVDVLSIRRRTGLSQSQFAALIGVPLPTLRNWEQGRRSPTGPTRVLLALLERNPRIVQETLVP